MDKEEFYELQLSEGLGKALTMDETQCLIHHLELCNKKHLNLLYVTKSWIDFFKTFDSHDTLGERFNLTVIQSFLDYVGFDDRWNGHESYCDDEGDEISSPEYRKDRKVLSSLFKKFGCDMYNTYSEFDF